MGAQWDYYFFFFTAHWSKETHTNFPFLQLAEGKRQHGGGTPDYKHQPRCGIHHALSHTIGENLFI